MLLLKLTLLLIAAYVVGSILAWRENRDVREAIREFKRWCREEGKEEYEAAQARRAAAAVQARAAYDAKWAPIFEAAKKADAMRRARERRKETILY